MKWLVVTYKDRTQLWLPQADPEELRLTAAEMSREKGVVRVTVEEAPAPASWRTKR